MFNQQMASLKYSQFNAGVSTLLKGYREVHVNHSYSQSLYHSWNKVFNQPAVNDEVESPQRNTLLMKPAAKALFDQLKEQIGEEIFVGEWFSVDQERINTFAEITQDMQWIHTDPQRAEQESPFKSTIAHGFLTMALLPKLTEAVDPEKPQFPTAKVTVNMGFNSVRFPYPVKVGSNIRGKCKLLSITPIKKGLEITREIKVEIEGVRRPGCVSESVIRLYF